MKFNIKNILTGWWHSLVWASLTTRLRSKERLKECEACENAVESQTLKVIRDMFEEVSEKKCSKPIGCGCPIYEKSLVKDETCPLNKWKT